jgi:4-amino-4-deoxy-L-arabinose transferase-like glycosyltransferase
MKSKKGRQKQKNSSPQKCSDWLKRGIFSKSFWSSPTGCLLLLVVVMGLGIFVRLAFLSADPPLDLSWSQDVNTDPGQYTSFARSKVLWGEWEPFKNPFLMVWLNSAYTLISFFFFKLLGVGRWQANLVVGVLSSLTLVFFYLAIRKGINQKVALLATFFLGMNYILVMYSRNTFAEVPVIFFFALGTYFLVLGFKRTWLLIFSGACFASAILFCKVSAWFMVLVCFCVFVLPAVDHSSGQRENKKWSWMVFFMLGLSAAALPWFLIICSGSFKTVYDFVFGMSVGMYGSPQAFHSVSDFIYSLFSFGQVTRVFVSEGYSMGTDLFYRMPVIFISSQLFLLGLFFKVFKDKKVAQNLRSCSKLELFFGLWLALGIFTLMPWNYRPLRYQVLIIPPMCALAAFYLHDLLTKREIKERLRVSAWFWIFSIPTASFLIFHVISFYLKLFGKREQLDFTVILSFAAAFVLHGVFYLVKGRKSSSFRKPLRLGVATAAILLVFLVNGGQFLAFAQNVQYSFLRASQDLGLTLGSEALISGPYAQTLTMDNKLKLMLRMFAGWPEDPDLFRKFPLTHLALEAKGGQREQASKDYPGVMKNAKLITTYHLRNFQVQILRVAESSGNPESKNYRLSDFEKAKSLIEEGQIDSAEVMLNQFVSRYPRNLSGCVALAEIYYGRKDFEKSALFLEKARKFDPTSSFIHQLLGVVYVNLYDQKGNGTHRLLAIEEWEEALRLLPQNTELLARLKKLRGD